MSGKLSLEETADFLRATVGELMDARDKITAMQVAVANLTRRAVKNDRAKRSKVDRRGATAKLALQLKPLGTFDSTAKTRMEARLARLSLRKG
jgi:hypothetical protein